MQLGAQAGAAAGAKPTRCEAERFALHQDEPRTGRRRL